jgi:hypothetical protein
MNAEPAKDLDLPSPIGIAQEMPSARVHETQPPLGLSTRLIASRAC